MPPVLASQKIGHSDLHFSNGSHFSYFLYVALLPTWLCLEPSYLAELCIYSGATHIKAILANILKIMVSFKFSHFALFKFTCTVCYEEYVLQ